MAAAARTTFLLPLRVRDELMGWASPKRAGAADWPLKKVYGITEPAKGKGSNNSTLYSKCTL